ncbi:hypothetical protein PISL3812_03182 [Talaromyces islandicus]|uniref:Uncharacterized protein n=1 Tax=Talaromyces islandicus TaxID=28573 RepID=A0A0U1LRZ9_TALIS|nr:hypothetical protein PISL3812_03182 [Talaromyces islandicus]
MGTESIMRIRALQNPLLLKMKAVGTANYVFHYHDTCIMTKWAAQHTGSQPHPLKPKIQHLYRDRDRNTLWWRAVSHHLPLKKVVRTTVAKRVRKIFTEVLFQQGYDPVGRPLALENLPEQIPVRHQPIRGSIEILVSKSAVTQEPQAMRLELTRLLSRTLRGMEDMKKNHGKKSKAAINAISKLLSTATKRRPV